MWTTFFCGCVLVLLVLYIPGLIQLLAAKCKAAHAVVFAPILSIFESSIVGVIFGFVGVSVSGAMLIGVVMGVAVAISCLLCVFKKRDSKKYRDLFSGSEISWKNISLYVLFAVLVVGYYFVRTLDGPESFVQEFDNAFHLNLIQAFSESGRYSVLQATTFPALPIQPLADLSYYPAAWHVLAAVCGNALGASAQMAENFTNTVLLSVVFPVSMCSFVSIVFRETPKVVPYCGLFVLAFAAFPWGFLVAGPLYSNLAAFAVLPAVMYCFISMLNGASRREAAARFVLLIIGVATLAIMQPNAVFTAVVILVPYCVVKIFLHFKAIEQPAKGVVFSVGFLVISLLVWTALRHVGMFQSVVNYTWIPYATMQQAIFDFLDLGYRNAVAQPFLAGLVLVGMGYLLYVRQNRWLICGYAFFFVAFLSAAATYSGFHGSFFSGFWYNDVDRLAACAVLVMVLFSGVGLYAVISIFLECVKRAWGANGSKRAVSVCFSLLCAGLVFAPNHILAGMGDVVTSIGSREARLSELATTEVSLTKDEIEFVSEVVNMIGKDAKVANFSFDGSVFAYTTNGLNTLSRHYFSAYNGNLDLLQEGLNEVSWNTEVQQAVRDSGVEYVLLLDADSGEESTIYQAFLDKDDWRGLTSIKEYTPGFNLVLSEGDMRLYEIEPVG